MPWIKNMVILEKWMAWRHKNTPIAVFHYYQCCVIRSKPCVVYFLEMAGTSRQIFNESEKMFLQELILKYKLNSVATTMGSPALRKAAWARLTEEYNATETNSKRTEAQLKKCWDNLKTRRKSILAQEKRERMRTGGGSFNPNLPSTSGQEQILEDALADQTDVELLEVIDSDTPIAEVQIDSEILPDAPQVPYASSASGRQINESAMERDHTYTTTPHHPESRQTDYNVAPSQGSRNIRTRVIQEEFSIRQKSYESTQKREEELHKLKIAEKEWLLKIAEENFFKAKAEREAAEELVRCNRAKREEAELHLAIFKNKNLYFKMAFIYIHYILYILTYVSRLF